MTPAALTSILSAIPGQGANGLSIQDLQKAASEAVQGSHKILGADVQKYHELPPMKLDGLPPPSSPTPNSIVEPTTWGHMVNQMVASVEHSQQVAGAKVQDVLRGGPTPVHEAMIAVEEASMSFQVLAEMRNKALDAYQEIMRMPV